MNHDFELGSRKRFQNLLGFAEAVAEKNRRFAVLERVSRKTDDVLNDLGSWRERVSRNSVRGFDYERVGLRNDTGFGSEVWTELEVARIEKRFSFSLQPKHRGSRNMASWVKAGIGSWLDLEWFVKIEGLPIALAWHSSLKQLSRALRAEDGSVLTEVVKVSVGNKCSGNGLSGIEMPVDFREIDPISLLDFPSHCESLDPFTLEADPSWTDEYKGEQC
jgi:hypothetical protein